MKTLEILLFYYTKRLLFNANLNLCYFNDKPRPRIYF